MTASAPATRLLLLLAALAAFSGSAAPASGRASGVRFVAGASRVVAGSEVSVSVSVRPSGRRCSLSVRYRGGASQPDLPSVAASSGRATWKWRVPRGVEPGRALLYVSCAGAGSAQRSLMVIGSVIPARIRVVKSGYSIRTYPYSGSSMSYGVILANESPQQDALDVNVLVNAVMDDNRLIGSATTRVSGIAAGTQHALGGELYFPGGAPVARLEIVVTIGRRGPATHTRPGLSAVRVLPDIHEPAWVGSVEGEVQNDHPSRTLQAVELSTVVLDAGGNVVGGGQGFESAGLPPAARAFFKITTGLHSISMGRAASALVSVTPEYARQ